LKNLDKRFAGLEKTSVWENTDLVYSKAMIALRKARIGFFTS
jgi:hypothetical protein